MIATKKGLFIIKMVGFNVGLELCSELLPTVWDFPKYGPETCHHNFDPPRREWLPRFGTPRSINTYFKFIILHILLDLHVILRMKEIMDT